jgi:hypothetical protein
MKVIYRKFPKTASLPVARHPQPLPFVCDNTKALSERFTETNSKVIAEWGNCEVWTRNEEGCGVINPDCSGTACCWSDSRGAAAEESPPDGYLSTYDPNTQGGTTESN